MFDHVMKQCDLRLTYFCHNFFYLQEANAPDDMYIVEYGNDGTSRPETVDITLIRP